MSWKNCDLHKHSYSVRYNSAVCSGEGIEDVKKR